MNKLEITGYCWMCGHLCKELFCNDKCKKAFELKERRQNQIRTGKRMNYGATSF